MSTSNNYSASYVKDSLLKTFTLLSPQQNPSFIQATNARQDEVFQRLHHDSASEKWLEDSAPRWHQNFGNWCINEKRYQHSEKESLADGARSAHLPDRGCSSSTKHAVKFTWQNTEKSGAKKTCPFYNK